MKKGFIIAFILCIVLGIPLSACQPAAPAEPKSGLRVLAVESFIADMAQNVAGDRLTVDTLMPLGLDPHAFEPTPGDVARISDSTVLIINGAGFEEWLDKVLANAGGERSVIEAAAGLESRTARESEAVENAGEEHHSDHGDPHFWLDPISVIHYVENIRDGLTAADPEGKDIYARNAEAYIAKLTALDAEIRTQVETIPAEKRMIVTNHESFGYYADRYGFTIVGTIVPSVSTNASPSAQQLARLVDHIRATGASAVFLETGSNANLAEQLASETGVKVITDLYTHSITAPDGAAPTYIEMLRQNTRTIVDALK